LSHALARDLLAEVPFSGGTRAASAVLHRHPLHTRVVLQSAVMRHALVKPRGYAGDMDLMLMLCDGVPRGNSPFARAVNDVFVRVPAAQAVRDRVVMLGRLLDQLPEGPRVLNLACGPALEVQRLFAARPERRLLLDLVDHDPQTLAYLRSRLNRRGVRILAGNAFRILAGDLRVPSGPADTRPVLSLSPGYDLIYSAGLYDYLPDAADGVGGAPQLTRVLFSLLNPGGLLLVGNYLKPTPTSGHQAHVQAMMELYSHWYLRYRSADEIAGFAATIDADYTVDLIDETGQPLQSCARPVIGFIAIRAA
jgi:extracellular factor (EF) 3-hydroxypalmitic acid methyl ester biosynthesis protein